MSRRGSLITQIQSKAVYTSQTRIRGGLPVYSSNYLKMESLTLLKNAGRMVIADLVTSNEVGSESIKSEDWCDCIDGALTKENHIDSISSAGFNKVEVIQETPYTERDARQITSVVIKATK
jgi:hypothetical protein